MAMPQDSDWSWLRAAAEAPEMTLEVYEALPEDLARQIEQRKIRRPGAVRACYLAGNTAWFEFDYAQLLDQLAS